MENHLEQLEEASVEDRAEAQRDAVSFFPPDSFDASWEMVPF